MDKFFLQMKLKLKICLKCIIQSWNFNFTANECNHLTYTSIKLGTKLKFYDCKTMWYAFFCFVIHKGHQDWYVGLEKADRVWPKHMDGLDVHYFCIELLEY